MIALGRRRRVRPRPQRGTVAGVATSASVADERRTDESPDLVQGCEAERMPHRVREHEAVLAIGLEAESDGSCAQDTLLRSDQVVHQEAKM